MRTLHNQTSFDLPTLNEIEQAHTELVRHHLANLIQEQGMLPFAQFMQQALYAPGLGYYSAGAQKLGKDGDFTTAPEISVLFGQCIANSYLVHCEQFTELDILEFGPGSGKLALDLMQYLEIKHALPNHYYLLEISASLKERQQQLIKTKIPHLYDRFVWLDQLPRKPIKAFVIANEVLDAMPVHIFNYQHDKLQEYYVDFKNNEFIWQLGEISSTELANKIKPLHNEHFKDCANYSSEINLLAAPFLQSISEILQEGVITLIDYGFLAHEYYHAQRQQGTLMCHYKHRAHTNPLINIGLQDLTAHVNFSELITTAENLGLKIYGYGTQAQFLLQYGLLDLLSNVDNEVYFNLSQQSKILLMPEEMGEIFKVLQLVKT